MRKLLVIILLLTSFSCSEQYIVLYLDQGQLRYSKEIPSEEAQKVAGILDELDFGIEKTVFKLDIKNGVYFISSVNEEMKYSLQAAADLISVQAVNNKPVKVE